MDHESFDRLVRLLGKPGSRRAALAALLGGGALAGVETAWGKKKSRNNGKKQNNRRNKKQRAGKQKSAKPAPAEGTVAAEATCGSPGPSSNLNGCNFNGGDLDGIDWSGSNLKNARFNGASLCGADLSSSTLSNADFRNANLTRADLHSSGCNGIQTNAATRFCQTIMCNGTVCNDDCPGGADVCCEADDCGQRECRAATCDGNGCAYAEQPDGQPGTLCPRECCGGACCPAGQKCCAGACIPNASCCAADCGPNQKCCGPNCIADTICCTNNTPNTCPPNQACCQSIGTGHPNDNDAGTCRQALGQTCGNFNDCCFPDFCCQNAGDPGNVCKAGSGRPCIGNDDCCNGAGFFCGRVNDDLAICCKPNEEDSCSDVSPCCPPLFCNDDFECEAP